MVKIKTLNSCDYCLKGSDRTTIYRRGELDWSRYTNEEGFPYFVNLGFCGKWRYIDELGQEWHVKFI